MNTARFTKAYTALQDLRGEMLSGQGYNKQAAKHVQTAIECLHTAMHEYTKIQPCEYVDADGARLF